MALKLRRKANILSLSLYPTTFQERNFNYCAQLSRISVMTNKIKEKKVFHIAIKSNILKKKILKMTFFTLPIISIWMTTVHSLWKLLLRVSALGQILIDTASSFCLLLIPGSFKKNLCPLINKGNMKTVVYIIFSPLGKC